MADYLIEQYNLKMNVIQDREASALSGALDIYTTATRTIVETAALERVDAGAELAAAMAARDHEYLNGRPALPKAQPLIVEETADENEGRRLADGVREAGDPAEGSEGDDLAAA